MEVRACRGYRLAEGLKRPHSKIRNKDSPCFNYRPELSQFKISCIFEKTHIGIVRRPAGIDLCPRLRNPFCRCVSPTPAKLKLVGTIPSFSAPRNRQPSQNFHLKSRDSLPTATLTFSAQATMKRSKVIRPKCYPSKSWSALRLVGQMACR